MSENKTYSRQFKADATLKVFLQMIQGEAVTYPWSSEELGNFSRWTGVSKEELKSKTAEELEKLAPLVFTGTARQEQAVIYVEPTQLEGYEPNTAVAYVNGEAVDIAPTEDGYLKIEVDGLEVGSEVEFAIPAGYHCLRAKYNSYIPRYYEAKELKRMSRTMLYYTNSEAHTLTPAQVYARVKVISEGVFRYINLGDESISFKGTFAGCSSLTTLPDGIFAGVNGSANAMFQGTFAGCSSLTTLPDGIFAGVSGSANAMFQGTFAGCSSLTTLPDGIFAGVSGSANAMFQGTFAGCSSLTTLPDGIFAGVSGSARELFKETFAGCSSLTTLPDGIFAGVSGSDNLMFYSVFSGCKSLSKINSDLFAGVGGVCKWTFLGAFKDCTSLLTIPEGLFRGISKDSIFAFIATFSGCKSLTGMTPKIQGKDLWAVGFVHKDIGNGCFKGCTKLSDYNEIPDDWK